MPREIVRFIPSSQFASELAAEIRTGYTLVPFVGAGFSVPSGIPMGQVLSEFLDYILYRCVAAAPVPFRLNLRGDRWPEWPTQSQTKLVRKWKSSTPLRRVEARGISLLGKWAESLEFLARLQMVGTNYEEFNPDPFVIDSFNTHITRGKKPNLGHTMLCSLAEPARIRTIITTNFDELIEEAFQAAGRDLNPITVSSKGELPDPMTVAARNSILKIHGGRLETRADRSLNVPPSQSDLVRFAAYVTGQPLLRKGSGDKLLQFSEGKLLVCGYSGADSRCRDMISHLLEHENIQVLWICHSQGGYEKVHGHFARHPTCGKNSEILATITDRTDLLLYEIYQQVTLSLPPASASYQYNQNVAPRLFPKIAAATAPLKTSHNVRKLEKFVGRKGGGVAVVKGSGKVVSLISSVIHPSEHPPETPPRERRGKAANGARPELSPRQSVWLDLEDYADAKMILFEILQILSLRVGHFQLDHCKLILEGTWDENRARELVSRVLECWNEPAARWCIALYGRNEPGRCAGWAQVDTRSWDRDKYAELHGLMKVLAGLGFAVIYAPMDSPRARLLNGALAPAIRSGHAQPVIVDPIVASLDYRDVINVVRKNPKSDDHAAVMQALRRSIARNEGRARAIYAATLFRQARHYSAFISEAVLPCPRRYNVDQVDNDLLRDATASKWLEEWRSTDWGQGLFLRKPGGFHWMYRDLRLGARIVAEKRLRELNDEPDVWCYRKARRFSYIAEWYGKAFRASGHVEPLLEALFHGFSAAAEIANYFDPSRAAILPAGRNAARRSTKAAVDYDVSIPRVFRRSILELAKNLRLGWQTLQLWLDKEAARYWFGEAVRRWIDAFGRVSRCNDALADHPGLWEQIRALADSIVDRPEFASVKPICVYGGTPRSADHPDESIELLPDVEWAAKMEVMLDGMAKGGAERALRMLRKVALERYTVPDRLAEDIRSCRELLCAASVVDGWIPRELLRVAMAVIARLKVEDRAVGENRRDLRRWSNVSALAWLVDDLCREIGYSGLTLDVRLRCDAAIAYGLSLGRLRRFYEAHRRLREAGGWLQHGLERPDPLQRGLLELRMCEVHLIEVTQLARILALIRPTNPTARPELIRLLHTKAHLSEEAAEQFVAMHCLRDTDYSLAIERVFIASIDRALASVEVAENELAGRAHSDFLWSQLHYLKLCIAARHATHSSFSALPTAKHFTSAMARRGQFHVEEIHSLVRSAIASKPNCPYHRLCVIHEGVKALIFFRTSKFKDKSDTDGMRRLVNELTKNFRWVTARKSKYRSSPVEKYYDRVRSSLDEIDTAV